MATKQLWTIQDGKLVANLHPGQAKAWNSDKRFILILAGSQGGKTSFGPLWLHREIGIRGPGDYLCVTASFPLLELKMLPEFRRLFEYTLHLGEWKEAKHAFIFSKEGCIKTFGHVPDVETRVIFASAVNPDSLESATAKAAWLDEAGQDKFRLVAYEAVLRRVSLNRGRVLLTTTPYNLGWLKKRLYDKWVKGDPDVDVIQFSSTLNPAFSQEEYEWAKKNLPEWRFHLFYDGMFAKPAGLIYSDFINLPREDGGHVIEPIQALPWGLERYGGIDFGATNQVALWIAYNPAVDEYYAYRDLECGNSTSAEAANRVSRADEHYNFTMWFGGAPGETQQRADWNDNGVPVDELPFSDVEAGIDRVTGLFRNDKLYICSNLSGLIEELGDYRRDTDDSGDTTDDILNKKRYHHLDALRYAVVGATGGNWMEPAGTGVAQMFGFSRRRMA
ncbi:MAG: terminase [Ignavibacteria bacterium]|jgi:hypothetical protein|nr:terminase [Ignavibacteria bacterium]